MNLPTHLLILAWVVGIGLLAPPRSATGQPLPSVSGLNGIHAQFAAKDAEIARLRQQLAVLNVKLKQAEELLARKEPALPQSQSKLPAAPADVPPASSGERWDTEYTFTGERISGAGPDMYYWAPGNSPNRHKASRPMPEGKTAEDYAKGFESICRELSVTAKRVGVSVFIVGVIPGYSPASEQTRNLHP